MHQIIGNFDRDKIFIWPNGEGKWSEFTNATKIESKCIVSHIHTFLSFYAIKYYSRLSIVICSSKTYDWSIIINYFLH